ncbi:MAG: hypothetical protein H6845_00755 [Alphaproteobacteria bacterium]|nr:MAG: hypothetical protein H6845_00755 [Alphaproteobacteria bacterium]
MNDENYVLRKVKSIFRYAFPIKTEEFKLFLPFSLLMFLILFNTTILKTLKDTLVITEKNSGAEVLNFLRVFIVVPISFLFVLAYNKACTKLDGRVLFYLILSLFSLFFLVFAFIMFPNKDYLHLSHEYISNLKTIYPKLRWIIPVYGLWTYSIFYSIADLWCSILLSLLFWQLTNQIIPKQDSKRFYSSFAIIGYFGLILGSHVVKKVFNFGSNNFEADLKKIILIILTANVFIVLIYQMLTNYATKKQAIVFKPKKDNLSLIESFKLLLQQKQLVYIMLLVFCYNFSVNIVEITWKSQLKHFAHTKSNFAYYSGTVNQMIGYLTIVGGFIANILLNKFKWTVSALITPILATITSFTFFAFIFLQQIQIGYLLGFNTLLLSIIFGAVHNVLTKTAKYVFFDQTKEIAYLNLNEHARTKGKAAIDVAGSRLSKSLSGQVQALLLIMLPNATQITLYPYICVILAIILSIWFYAIKKLEQSADDIR